MTKEKFEEIVSLLNELLSLDREAISKIYTTRLNCTFHLDQHPRILTRNDGHPTVSGLGVLNAIIDIATDDQFRIGVQFDWESNLVDKFVLISR